MAPELAQKDICLSFSPSSESTRIREYLIINITIKNLLEIFDIKSLKNRFFSFLFTFSCLKLAARLEQNM